VRIEMNTTGNSIKVISKNNDPRKNFSIPETKSRPKIYIIKTGDSIIYIGKTNQPIASRLRQGLKPNNSNGYHGYKWKNKEEIKIICITLEPYNNVSDDDLESDLESIEAELVYNHRNITGLWPSSQTEIHFHNNEKMKEFAKKLFEEINK
jgi:hypothetical protein